MPKKKKNRNGFWIFVQELRENMIKEGFNEIPSMSEMVPIADKKWKALSEEERQHYKQLAKSDGKPVKLDIQFSPRSNAVSDAATNESSEMDHLERRKKNKMDDYKTWPPFEDIVNKKFHLITFLALCKVEEEDRWIPNEVGLVEWSMKQGITNTYHRFINPGPIPLGYRFACMQLSEETHKIPVEGFHLADDDYRKIYNEIQQFVSSDSGHRPVMYSLHAGNGEEWLRSQSCIQWLYAAANPRQANILDNIHCIEDLVLGLYDLCGQSISESSVIQLLTTSRWDYEPDTRCSYHEELDVKDCALAICRRYAFALSDMLRSVYDFELTDKHLPAVKRGTAMYRVISPMSSQQRTKMDSAPSSASEKNNDPWGNVGKQSTYQEKQPYQASSGLQPSVPSRFSGGRGFPRQRAPPAFVQKAQEMNQNTAPKPVFSGRGRGRSLGCAVTAPPGGAAMPVSQGRGHGMTGFSTYHNEEWT